MGFLGRDCSFHGIMLDVIMKESIIVKKLLHSLVEEGIKSGAVTPLNRTVFPAEQVEEAFR